MSGRLGPHELDPSVRRAGPGGQLLIGGSPTRLVRLTAAGSRLVDRLAAGAELDAAGGTRALVDRLTAGGLAHPVPPPETTALAAELTVVVPVRDHGPQLGRLLASLEACVPAPVRVVVVDDGSTEPIRADDPVEVVRRERPGGPAAARNAGLALVRTRYVAFVDADCTVGAGWLGPLLAQLRDPGVALVAPRVVAAQGSAPTALERFDRDRSPLDLGPLPAHVRPGARVSYVPSAALVGRTEVLRSLGGFDEAMHVGEDVDLVWRLVEQGATVRYEPRSVVHHDVRPDLGSWLEQRFRYGTSAAALDERHPGAVAPVVCSPWSLLVWCLVVIGRPFPAAGVVGYTLGRLRRQLRGVPSVEAARLVVGGHAAAGGQLAGAVVRDWWPLAVAASVVSRRARRIALACWAVSLFRADRRRSGTRCSGPAAFTVLWTADQLAYGAGVWAGVVRRRRWRALLPRRTGPRR